MEKTGSLGRFHAVYGCLGEYHSLARPFGRILAIRLL